MTVDEADVGHMNIDVRSNTDVGAKLVSAHLTTSSKAPGVSRSALYSSMVPGSAAARALRCATLASLLASRTVARTWVACMQSSGT